MTVVKYFEKEEFDALLHRVRGCEICRVHLPESPRPILQASVTSRVLVIGQAPGIKAHESNLPWNDASGDRLRAWLGIDRNTFYNAEHIAIVPMGFCYPGKGKSGDLPPRKECATTWHEQLLGKMPIGTTFLIGQYAQNYYLQDGLALTDRVKRWREYFPRYVVLPHPSPRNNIWLKKNEWFEREAIPEIRARVSELLVSE